MPMISTIVFDASGTLIDDIYTVWNANSDSYEAFGFRRFATLEESKEKFKLPIPEFHRGNGIPDDIIDEVENKFRQFYPRYSSYIKIFPDVEMTLKELRKRQIVLAVASNIPSLFLQEHLQHFGIADYFNAIIGQDDIREQKPSPDSILVALEKLRARPNGSAYIGDMEEDIIAGKRAGVYTIAISRESSYHPTWKLRRQNPDYFISSMDELLLLA